MQHQPRDQVRRPRLLSLLEQGRVAVVEAGGGFGKSALAAEYRRALGIPAVTAVLEARDADPASFLARLRGALERAGWSDLAGTLQARPEGLEEALDAFLDALGREEEPRLLVLDDAHHARDAAGLIARLTAGLPARHRLLVLTRRLSALADLPPGAVAVGAADLAFTADEVRELCADAFGVDVDARHAETLRVATGGWAAALRLAAHRLARAPDVASEVEAIGAQRTVLGYLLDRQLRDLGPAARAAVPQAAHLPLLSQELVDGATGIDGLYGELLDAGLPVEALRDGWAAFPGPVQEHLAALAAPSPEVAGRAAAAYEGRGELMPAFDVLLAAGLAGAAARLLAGLPPARSEQLDFADLRVAVEAVGDDALREAPRLLLQLAHACEGAGRFRLRADVLRRAGRLLAAGQDPALRREIDAERARDLVRDGQTDAAERLAARVLAAAGPGELSARARSLDVQGRVRAWRRDPESLTAAEPLLEDAYRLCRSLGRRTWAAQVVQPLATGVLQARGQLDDALARYDDALALLPGRSRQRAVVLTFCAAVLHDLGRYEEASARLAEARQLARVLSHPFAAAYAAWEAARGASQRGDGEAVLRELEEAERHRGDWFEHWTGAEFLAEAADCLDRAGEPAAARAYLARALARVDEAEVGVRRAEGAVEARSGDPAEAERMLAAVAAMPRLTAVEAWRVTLLRAYAAARGGSDEAGPLARLAFEAAATLGYPELPLIREGPVARQLLALAARAGSPAALGLAAGHLATTVTTLGRFEVSRGGRRVDLPAGRPAQLVKLLAVTGGRLHAEQAIEALWPETDPGRGRRGLRNVLDRLRRAGAELVLRDGEDLRLAAGLEVDAIAFEQEAGQALNRPPGEEAAALARSALARYGGELLPDDRYESWAAVPRERAQLRYLALVGVLLADAEARNDLDEALRLLERALDVDPLDEERYLRAAGLLLAQGRRLRALTMLRRGTAALERLGIPRPPAYELLERAIFASESP